MADQETSPLGNIQAIPDSRFSKLTTHQQVLIDTHLQEVNQFDLNNPDTRETLFQQIQKERDFFSDPVQVKLLETAEQAQKHVSKPLDPPVYDPGPHLNLPLQQGPTFQRVPEPRTRWRT